MCEVPYLMCQKTRKAQENGKKGDLKKNVWQLYVCLEV